MSLRGCCQQGRCLLNTELSLTLHENSNYSLNLVNVVAFIPVNIPTCSSHHRFHPLLNPLCATTGFPSIEGLWMKNNLIFLDTISGITPRTLVHLSKDACNWAISCFFSTHSNLVKQITFFVTPSTKTNETWSSSLDISRAYIRAKKKIPKHTQTTLQSSKAWGISNDFQGIESPIRQETAKNNRQTFLSD